MKAKMTEIEVTDLAIDELTKHNMSPLFSYRCAFIYGVRNRENELLPQIEKLQGEIEFSNERLEEAAKKHLKNLTKIAQLTAKHDALVKWLNDEDRHFVETNEVLEKLTGEEGNV